MQPFEVSYTTTGRKGKKVRNVIGVLCPTVIAQRMGIARPIFVSLGDVVVDWNMPQSEGYRAMFDTPNIGFTRKEAFALAWATGRTLKRVNGRWIVGGVTL